MDTEASSFKQLISNRVSYIESLNDLQDNWISPIAKKPSKEVLQLSVSVLKIIEKTLLNCSEFPKLLMCPLPIGGFGFDIMFDEEDCVSIYLIDDNKFSLQYCFDSTYFDDTYIDFDSLTYRLFFILKAKAYRGVKNG